MMLKTRVIPGIMWNQRKLPTETKPTQVKKKKIIKQEKNQQIQ